MIRQNCREFAAEAKEIYHVGCEMICEEMEQGNDPIGDYFDGLAKIGLLAAGGALLFIAAVIALMMLI